ncbi:MAG: hypothetical protein FWG64_08600 [Firmicutes bacterium]|nr:hypothetical protein [Bacillota bacterium]
MLGNSEVIVNREANMLITITHTDTTEESTEENEFQILVKEFLNSVANLNEFFTAHHSEIPIIIIDRMVYAMPINGVLETGLPNVTGAIKTRPILPIRHNIDVNWRLVEFIIVEKEDLLTPNLVYLHEISSIMTEELRIWSGPLVAYHEDLDDETSPIIWYNPETYLVSQPELELDFDLIRATIDPTDFAMGLYDNYDFSRFSLARDSDWVEEEAEGDVTVVLPNQSDTVSGRYRVVLDGFSMTVICTYPGRRGPGTAAGSFRQGWENINQSNVEAVLLSHQDLNAAQGNLNGVSRAALMEAAMLGMEGSQHFNQSLFNGVGSPNPDLVTYLVSMDATGFWVRHLTPEIAAGGYSLTFGEHEITQEMLDKESGTVIQAGAILIPGTVTPNGTVLRNTNQADQRNPAILNITAINAEVKIGEENADLDEGDISLEDAYLRVIVTPGEGPWEVTISVAHNTGTEPFFFALGSPNHDQRMQHWLPAPIATVSGILQPLVGGLIGYEQSKHITRKQQPQRNNQSIGKTKATNKPIGKATTKQ